MGNAPKSILSFDSTDSEELEVGGLLFICLLLNGAEAFRRARPMLERLWRSVDVDFRVASCARVDVLSLEAGSSETGGKEEVRLVLTRICGVAVGAVCGCSSRITG